MKRIHLLGLIVVVAISSTIAPQYAVGQTSPDVLGLPSPQSRLIFTWPSKTSNGRRMSIPVPVHPYSDWLLKERPNVTFRSPDMTKENWMTLARVVWSVVFVHDEVHTKIIV